jgi:hypothetical protein
MKPNQTKPILNQTGLQILGKSGEPQDFINLENCFQTRTKGSMNLFLKKIKKMVPFKTKNRTTLVM